MFNYEDFYKLYNGREEARYRARTEQLETLMQQMTGTKERGFREKMFWYVKTQGELLLLITQLEAKWNAEYYASASMADMKQDQALLYRDVLGQAYEKSYANPAYMAHMFSKDKALGPVLAAFAKLFHDAVQDAYCHRRYRLSRVVALFLDLQKQLLHGAVHAEQLTEMFRQYMLRDVESSCEVWFHKKYNVSEAMWTDVLRREDLTEPYYLYQMGVYVSEQAVNLQRFFAGLPKETLDKLAHALTKGYKKAYIRQLKDMHKRKTAPIYYPLGMERLVLRVMEILKSEMKMEPYIARIDEGDALKQYEYDHRFDSALYLDEAYGEQYQVAVSKLAEQNAALLKGYGGPVVIEGFGAQPFVPQLKEESLRLSQEQSQLAAAMDQAREQKLTEVGILDETSYTMMALPVPAIGEQYSDIFHEIVQINCMDGEQMARAQHSLIGMLDHGRAVHVKGRGVNETDLMIGLQPLENPRRQTNFMDCMADINIPAGEVLTSPQLKGTHGVLHIEKAYLQGVCFDHLRLTFEDGYITEYTCSNFEEEEQNRRYIYENLLHPYDTLPMGEFAVGTNTWAYAVAQQYDIMSVLPALIIEKLGPHFALGDTCFAYQEAHAVFNPTDRKEVTARGNERSALRSVEPSRAYTHKHIVMTLPFNDIGRISIVKEDGMESDIVREGRFVLIGTDTLNAPLIALENERQQKMGE